MSVDSAEQNDAVQVLDDTELDKEVRFAGDTGTLPTEARRVLVRLLLGPAVDARRQDKLWQVLKRHHAVLRSRLHDMFLDLIVDDESQVAFLRQVVSEEVDIPILLRRQSLTFLDSVLLLFLRQRLTQSDAQGERAVVDTLEMQEYLKAYERADNVDASRFGRQTEQAVEKAKKLGVLLKLPGTDDRFEVSATLRLLFSVDDIKALTEAYRKYVPGEKSAPAAEED